MSLWEHEGRIVTKYNDSAVRLLLPCSKKSQGEEPDGTLLSMLNILGLNSSNNYNDIKVKLWEHLDLQSDSPLLLLQARSKPIIERKIDNAGEVMLLRKQELKPFLEKLGIDKYAHNEDILKALFLKLQS